MSSIEAGNGNVALPPLGFSLKSVLQQAQSNSLVIKCGHVSGINDSPRQLWSSDCSQRNAGLRSGSNAGFAIRMTY
jgi:hypothetical protein